MFKSSHELVVFWAIIGFAVIGILAVIIKPRKDHASYRKPPVRK